MLFEFRQAHGAKTQPPEISRGMEKIEVSAERGTSNCASHAVTGFKERPVERFAVESDEHGTFGQALRESQENRMFFALFAHEELFDFESASIPPGDADQEWIRSGASGKAGGFRIEKEPIA
jgi:hypothetical protein